MRERFVPALEYHGADLNLTGHSHSYERSVLIDGHYSLAGSYRRAFHAKDASSGSPDSGGYTKDPGPNQGAIYSVVGSSSKNQGALFEHPIMFYSENIEGSVVIDIEGAQMDAYFIRNDGAVNDVYRLTKNIEEATVDHVVGLFPAHEEDPVRQGFVRVINHTARAIRLLTDRRESGGSPVVASLRQRCGPIVDRRWRRWCGMSPSPRCSALAAPGLLPHAARPPRPSD